MAYSGSPVGDSLQTFIQTYLGLQNAKRQREQQSFENDRMLRHDADANELHQSQLASEDLRRRTLQQEMEDRPRKIALENVKNISSVLGEEGFFNSPDAMEEAKRAGISIPTKQVALPSSSIMGIASGPRMALGGEGLGKQKVGDAAEGGLVKGPLSTKEDIASRMGVAPETGAVLPSDIATKKLEDEKKQAIARAMIGLTQGKGVAGLSPDQSKRLLVSTGFPGVSANEVFGAVPQGAEGGSGMGDDALKGLSDQEANLVKKIANYDIGVSASAMRSPQWSRLLKLASAYDPSFDQAQFGIRSAVRKDYTSGKSFNNVKSLNTVIGHLASLQAAGEGLHNGQYPLLNMGKNFMARQTGKGNPVAFANAANAVESEAAQLFKGMGATDQEIKAWRQNLGENMSPEQLKASIGTMIELMGSRMHALDEGYTRGIGKPRDFSILNDKSRKILTSFGVDPDSWDTVKGAAEPTAPTPTSTPAGPKTATAQDLADYAEAAGVDMNAAAAAFRAKGYTLVK